MIAAALAVAVLLAVKIKGTVTCHHNRLKAVVSWFGVPLLKREYVLRREEGKPVALYRAAKTGEERVLSLRDVIRFFSKKPDDNADIKKALLYIHSKAAYKLTVGFEIGTGDAMLTALSCGLLQSAIGALSAMRGNRKMELAASVAPQFSKQTLRFDLDCIIKAAPVNIMIGYMIYKKRLRR